MQQAGHDVSLDTPYTVVDFDENGCTIERNVHLVHGETTQFVEDVQQVRCSSANIDSLVDKDVSAITYLPSMQSRDSTPIISPSVYCQPSATTVQSTNTASLPSCENELRPNSVVNESQQMNDSSDDLLKMMSAMSISSGTQPTVLNLNKSKVKVSDGSLLSSSLIFEDGTVSTVNDSLSTVVDDDDINLYAKQLDGFKVSTALHSTTDDQDYNASEKQTDLATDDVHVVTVDGVEGKLTEPSNAESNESKYNHDDEKCLFTEMTSTENEIKEYELGRSEDIIAPSEMTISRKPLRDIDNQDSNTSKSTEQEVDSDTDTIAWDEFENKELTKHVSSSECELPKQSLYVQFDPLLKQSPMEKDPKLEDSQNKGTGLLSCGDNVFATTKQKLIDIESDEIEEATERSSPSVIIMNMDEYEVDVDGRSSIIIPSHKPPHTTSYVVCK
ncbi:uncharacterized protein LOC100183142 [Ciona intestinalis]